MGTIRKRGDYQFQAQVRRTDYPPQSKTFNTKKDAEKWVRAISASRCRWATPSRRMVRAPTVNNARERRLEAGEESRLLAALDASHGRHLISVALLALETAMRRGELLALRWEHVDLKRRVAHLPETKNGKSRDVPLSRETLIYSTLR